MPSRARFIGTALVLASIAACGEDTTPNPAPVAYQATIRRTAYGIPHIKANDLGSMAFGLGYAAAQDYGCYLADQIVKIQSKRAATFGPGDGDANIDSDFAYENLAVEDTAAAELPKQPKEVRDLVAGYVAGYNRWIADTGVDHLPAPCTGAKWVAPITPVDLAAYTLDLALRGSAVALLNYVSAAAPPKTALPPEPPRRPSFDFAHPGFGSNGWGIGRDRSAAGGGILLANPHFQWEGEVHWHEAHLTVPGVLDVYGVSILGSPTIQIGFNKHVAWTHTVTPSQHFTVYKLALMKGDPTTYVVDGVPHPMHSKEYSIDVKAADGTTSSVKRTMWRTDYGVMASGPGLSWGMDTAYAARDANEGDVRLAEQWLRIDQASSVGDIQQALGDVHANPWVYTIAADDKGDAMLMDGSRVPNLSDETIAAYQAALKTDITTKLLASAGATLLDGSTSRDVWIHSDEPYADGLVPGSKAPQLVRQDFVMNANDAPWATNPASPITGYSFLYGAVFGKIIPRTRMNLEMLTETGKDAASGDDGKFTADEVEAALFSDRERVAEQLRADVVTRCTGAPAVTVNGTSVDLTAACAALGAWNGRADLDAKGANLWRELLGQFLFSDTEDAGSLYSVAFDPKSPITTPNTLVAKPQMGDDPILVALAKAVLSLKAANLAVDSTLEDSQYTMKGSVRIPIPGGQDLEGAANVVSYYAKGNLDTSLLPEPKQPMVIDGNTSLTSEGYLCTKGSSFVMVADMTKDGPKVRAILTTSESRDPSSIHYEDQTLLFAKKQLRDVLFTEAEIAADPTLTTKTLVGAR